MNTPLRRALAALTLALAASPAAAQDRFLELQVDAPPLADFFRAQVIEQVDQLCPGPVPSALCGNQTCYLDHVDVLPGGSFRRSNDSVEVALGNRLPPLQTAQLQYLQPIHVALKTLACINDPACPHDSYAQAQDLTLVMNLRMKGSKLCVTPAGFLEPIPADVLGDVDEVCVPVDLGAARAVVGDGFDTTGVAISADAAADAIAIRVELLPHGITDLPANLLAAIDAGRQAAWQAFLDGAISETGVGDPFRVFLTADLLSGAIRSRFARIIDDVSMLEADGPITGSWTPWPGSGRLGAHLFAEADTGVCPNTIGLEIFANLPVSLEADGLHLDGTLSWDANDADVFLCGALFGGFVFAPITAPIAAAIAAGFSPDPNAVASTECDAHETDDGMALNCVLPIEDLALGNGTSFLRLSFDAATPSFAGLTLHGAAIGGGVGQAPIGAVQVSGSIGWGATGGCHDMHLGYSGSIQVHGARICDATIRDDQLHVYDFASSSPNSLAIDFPSFLATMCPYGDAWVACPAGQAPIDQFWQAPYPMHTRILTNRGAFSFAIPAPKQPTQAQVDAAQMQMVLQRVNCMTLETGWLGIPGLYDPHWTVDPPPYEDVMQRTRLGSQRIGTVTLSRVRVSAPELLTDRLGVLRTRAVPLTFQATAVVDAGRAGRFSVPITVPLQMDYAAQTVLGRLTGLRSTNTVNARVDLSAGLPASLAGSTFNLALPAGAVALQSR